MIVAVVFMMFCVICCSHASLLVLDFCVADLTARNNPSGYSCKNLSTVTASEFKYSGLAHPGNTNNAIGSAFTPAFVDQFPAVNGLGISMGRIDFARGGFIPIHSHPRANEILYVAQGNITVAFISTNNTPYLKTLHTGDIWVFPKALLHFLINAGNGTATVIASYSSANPGTQVTALSLFSNNITTNMISQITSIAESEVTRLKARFGGSG